MAKNSLLRFAAWFALIAMFITLFTIVAFAIGISAGWEKVGSPNDIAVIVMYSLHIPILAGLDKTFDRPRHAQFTLGILATLVVTKEDP